MATARDRQDSAPVRLVTVPAFEAERLTGALLAARSVFMAALAVPPIPEGAGGACRICGEPRVRRFWPANPPLYPRHHPRRRGLFFTVCLCAQDTLGERDAALRDAIHAMREATDDADRAGLDLTWPRPAPEEPANPADVAAWRERLQRYTRRQSPHTPTPPS